MIGADLEAAVSAAGLRLAHADTITGLPATALGRATFRLTLDDGRVLKGRRLDSAADADRIRSVVGALDRPEMPRILAQCRTALLEEWIDGEPLARAAPSADFLERCGRILGGIHATPLAGPVASHPAPAAMDAYRSRAEWTVAALTGDGILGAGMAADIRALMSDHAPARVTVGYAHGDFCAENIVRRRDGGPAIVDNGSVGLEAVDFDLARTWYRWPMRASERRAFDAGYRTAGATGQSTAAFPFWALLVLTEATLFRARAGADGWRWPLTRLERLLRDRRRRDAAAS